MWTTKKHYKLSECQDKIKRTAWLNATAVRTSQLKGEQLFSLVGRVYLFGE